MTAKGHGHAPLAVLGAPCSLSRRQASVECWARQDHNHRLSIGGGMPQSTVSSDSPDTNADWQARRQAAIPRGVSTLLPVFVAKAENAELWDVEGRRYIDFASGIAVLNIGHMHPRVKAAVAGQLEKFSHTCFQINPYPEYVQLAERLNQLAPGPTPKKTIFFNSGAEAVENAVKIARAHTRRNGVIAFSGGFHGRTMMA
ncbi:MAG: aminotransferase class III-fold pyridoxal phosphate-dependent enzyme, partial [Xanthomonadales bacterium]|nr:aminotransferase class III-fold pyridoxal phosphate-dependent enzyme [Xanthomonadales bacterium]